MSLFLRRTPLRSLLTTRTFTTTTRIMAPKQEWMVILPDYTGKLAERNQVRACVNLAFLLTSKLSVIRDSDIDLVITSRTPLPTSNLALSF